MTLNGFNKQWLTMNGFNKQWMTLNGFNKQWMTMNGFNKRWMTMNGFNKQWMTMNGFNKLNDYKTDISGCHQVNLLSLNLRFTIIKFMTYYHKVYDLLS